MPVSWLCSSSADLHSSDSNSQFCSSRMLCSSSILQLLSRADKHCFSLAKIKWVLHSFEGVFDEWCRRNVNVVFVPAGSSLLSCQAKFELLCYRILTVDWDAQGVEPQVYRCCCQDAPVSQGAQVAELGVKIKVVSDALWYGYHLQAWFCSVLRFACRVSQL